MQGGYGGRNLHPLPQDPPILESDGHHMHLPYVICIQGTCVFQDRFTWNACDVAGKRWDQRGFEYHTSNIHILGITSVYI